MKQKVSVANKKVDEQDLAEAKAFMEAIKAVEEEHSMRIVPMIDYSSQGIFATLGRQRVDKIVLEADKK